MAAPRLLASRGSICLRAAAAATTGASRLTSSLFPPFTSDARLLATSATHRSIVNTAAVTGAADARADVSSSRASSSSPDSATCQLEVWSWGRGDSGQLGHGEENPEWVPRRIESISLEISEISRQQWTQAAATASEFRLRSTSGAVGSDAVERDAVELRREDASGQEAASQPTSEPTGSAKPNLERLRERLGAGVSCGISHSLLWLGGRLWVWGRGDGGRLGLGGETSLFSPTLNPNFPGGVRSAAAGGLHSLAVSDDGALFTWGYGGFGALGHGEFTRRDVPCQVAPSDWLEEGVEIKMAAAGASHTLALSTAGTVYAWGRDEGEGRLGCPEVVEALGEEGCVPRPIPIAFPAAQGLPRGGLSLVACGGFFSAAVDCDGGVWTWGGNENGELGRGVGRSPLAAATALLPARVKSITSPVTHLAAGGFHTLAVDDEGRVWSWGRGGSGQLGQRSLLTQPVPGVIPALAGVRIVRVAAGSAWSAAVSDEGQLFVWGKNADGQLGLGAGQQKIIEEPRELPLPSLPLPSHWSNTSTDTVRRVVLDVGAGTSHGLCICACLPI